MNPYIASLCVFDVCHVALGLMPFLQYMVLLPFQKAEESQQRQEEYLEQKLAQQNKTSWAGTAKTRSVDAGALCLYIYCTLLC